MSLRDELIRDMERDSEPPEPPPYDDPTMSRLVELGNEMDDLKDEMDRLKARANEVRERYDTIRKVTIPDLMQYVGLAVDGKGRFTNSRGSLVSLRTDIYASYRKDREDLVFSWLRDNDMGDVIRPTVHPSTFRSLVRERIADGKTIPEFITQYNETTATLRRSKS